MLLLLLLLLTAVLVATAAVVLLLSLPAAAGSAAVFGQKAVCRAIVVVFTSRQREVPKRCDMSSQRHAITKLLMCNHTLQLTVLFYEESDTPKRFGLQGFPSEWLNEVRLSRSLK